MDYGVRLTALGLMATSLKSLVDGLIALNEGSTIKVVQGSWLRIVGQQLVGHCYPRKIERDRLIITVANSSWLYALTFHKGRILKRLKDFHPQLKISAVTFEIGTIDIDGAGTGLGDQSLEHAPVSPSESSTEANIPQKAAAASSSASLKSRQMRQLAELIKSSQKTIQ